jgi:zinc-binding alcohol dehydrogenase/oxidoreductase
MIEFISLHNIRPIIEEVFALKEYQKGFSMMERAQQFGKIVFDNSSQ